MRSVKSSSVAPNNALRQLAGVGPAVIEKFNTYGIFTPRDLLLIRPRTYRDWRTPNTIAEVLETARDGADDQTMEVLLVGTVGNVTSFHRNVSLQKADFTDGSGSCRLLWFGRRGPRAAIKSGMRLLIQGRPKFSRQIRFDKSAATMEVNVLAHRELGEDEPYHGRIWPVYPATKDLPTRIIAKTIERNFDRLLEELPPDPLPRELQVRHGLIPLALAWRNVHIPRDMDEVESGQMRIAYDTFFKIAFAALYRRMQDRKHGRAVVMHAPPGLLQRFENELPFAPTGAQFRVIDDIWRDMASEAPMNRLLQGDVGSGKTLVAAAAIVLAASAGTQSAFMAPTELLARQHARKLAPLLLPFGIGVEFIAATQQAKARRASEERLRGGAIAVAVGTHALLTERTEFARLGLAIIDEQHRFGVMQRATLRAKGESVHTLAMTATPIPRTLAQTRYIDLDVSIIDELPPGRTPVKTFIRDETARPKIYEFIRSEVSKGRQAYIVAPVIEVGESELTSAVEEAEELAESVFPDLRTGLVHGKLPSRERDSVMERFAAGQIDILIATTVIEVGVDVPNASVMVILDAHRFGLAQLHQLRGRVGRGTASAMCILVAPRKTARLQILTQTNDGFVIADADLELRGEGEFSGTLQSGTGGSLIRSQEEVELYLKAKDDAERVLTDDPDLRDPVHCLLRTYLTEDADEIAKRVTS